MNGSLELAKVDNIATNIKIVAVEYTSPQAFKQMARTAVAVKITNIKHTLLA